MEVRCEQCLTEYEFEESLVTERGVSVKCTQCGHLFWVFPTQPRRRTLPASVASPAAASGPEQPVPPILPTPAQPDGSEVWRLRQPGGTVFTFQDWATLHQWIMEGRVSPRDEVARPHGSWQLLSSLPEAAGFFRPTPRVPPVPGAAGRTSGSPFTALLDPDQRSSPSPFSAGREPSGAGDPSRSSQWSMATSSRRNVTPFHGLGQRTPSELGLRPAKTPVPFRDGFGEIGEFDEYLDEVGLSNRTRWFKIAGMALGLLLLFAIAVLLFLNLRQGAQRSAVLPQTGILAASGQPAGALPAGAPPAIASSAPAGSAPLTTGTATPIAPTEPPAATPVVIATAPTVAAASPPASGSEPGNQQGGPPPAIVPEPVQVATVAPAVAPPQPTGSASPEVVATKPRQPPIRREEVEPPPVPPTKSATQVDALLKQAHGRLIQGKTNQALALYQKALELNPESAEAYAGSGWCFLDRGTHHIAVLKFKETLNLNPSFYDALIGLGKAYQGMGQVNQAKEAYLRYLKLNPNGPKASIAKAALEQLPPGPLPPNLAPTGPPARPAAPVSSAPSMPAPPAASSGSSSAPGAATIPGPPPAASPPVQPPPAAPALTAPASAGDRASPGAPSAPNSRPGTGSVP